MWVKLLRWSVVVLILAAVGAPVTRAQVLGPEQSSAKAKQLIQQAIQALGGEKYLNVRDTSCTGRVAFYDNHGQLSGFDQ
ncbi:MAG TPA: hypothetical protein VLD18_13390, partial [Verrucomicrobiae bacterium]|nr:hypothetical protein [Verrucomicrobiae bacterium]